MTLVPHKQFTFAKLWLMFAKFEVRRLELPAARKILGTGIGMCPKEALFKGYVDLEIEVSGISLIFFHDKLTAISAPGIRSCTTTLRKIFGSEYISLFSAVT